MNVRQDVNEVGRVELVINPDRQTFSGELVDDVEHPAIMGPALDEVIGPSMVWMLGPKRDAIRHSARAGLCSVVSEEP
jgi:hypothetical protein